MARKPAAPKVTIEAQPQYKVEYREIQPYGTLKKLPLALEDMRAPRAWRH
jgi:starvation-inducible DNA-binding protein